MYKYINSFNQKEFSDFISKLSTDINLVGFDTETSGLDPLTSRLLLIQVSLEDSIYIFNCVNLEDNKVKYLVELLNSSDKTLIGHNIKFDVKLIKAKTDVLLTKVHDTMVCEAMLVAGIGSLYPSLKDLVLKYSNQDLTKDSREEFIGFDGSTFSENALMYSALDVKYLKEIYEKQMIQIQETKMNRVYDLEMKLVPVVAMMELDGVLLDKDAWIELAQNNEKRVIELKEKLRRDLFNGIDFSNFSNGLKASEALAIPVHTKRDKTALESISDTATISGWLSDNFNLNSSYQLKAALNLIGIKAENTNQKYLEKLPKHGILDTISEMREYGKLVSTYGLNVVEFIHSLTGRIHVDYNQIGTYTGRFSSSGGVNLQNQPRKQEFRNCYIAPDGKVIITCDYSQAEYRLVGAVSGELVIIEAYKNGFDMHTATGGIVYNKDIKNVTKEDRYNGKQINFLMIYGGSEYSMRRNFNVPLDEGRKIIKEYFDGYPILKHFKRQAEELILELGYSVTPLGRRRYNESLPTFFDSFEYEKIKRKIVREGFNHIIQGGSADITKLAMLNIFYNNPFGHDKFKLILQTHDEVAVEVDESIAKEAEEFIVESMEKAEQPFLGEIPAKADSYVGKSWGEKH